MISERSRPQNTTLVITNRYSLLIDENANTIENVVEQADETNHAGSKTTKCLECGNEYTKLLMHLSKSIKCQASYDMDKLKSQSRDRRRENQNKSKRKSRNGIQEDSLKEQCLGCKIHFTKLLGHLSKSSCKAFYSEEILNSRIKERQKNKQRTYDKLKKNECETQEGRYQSFQNKIRDGLHLVCVSCQRIMYREAMEIFDHLKEYKVEFNTTVTAENDGKLYICKTCLKYLNKNELPPLCTNNGLELDELDEDLDLTELEHTLIARKILFLKLHIRNPSQIWHNKDRVVNVTLTDDDLYKTLSSINSFPRRMEDSGIIPVNFKRKLQYSNNALPGPSRPHMVDYNKMIRALEILKKSKHPSYQHFEINQPEEFESSDEEEGVEGINKLHSDDRIEF